MKEIVAVDQDRESLAVVEREQGAHNVTPVHASVRRFLVDPSMYGSFDLAYAAGLYDYLEEPIAISLTRAMFEALVPGGMLLIANFAPELREIGYMEAIMDWNLIYRGESEMTRLALGIPTRGVASTCISRDTCGNIVSRERSTGLGVAYFGVAAVGYAMSFASIALMSGWPARLAMALVNGLAVGIFFIVGHDACHGSLTSSSTLNKWLGRVAFLPSLHPFAAWEYSHNALHHGFTNLRGRIPSTVR